MYKQVAISKAQSLLMRQIADWILENVGSFSMHSKLTVWVDFDLLEEFVELCDIESEDDIQATLQEGHLYIEMENILSKKGIEEGALWELIQQGMDDLRV